MPVETEFWKKSDTSRVEILEKKKLIFKRTSISNYENKERGSNRKYPGPMSSDLFCSSLGDSGEIPEKSKTGKKCSD